MAQNRKGVIYVIYVGPFSFDSMIDREVPEVYIVFPVLIGAHTHNWIPWTLDVRHDNLESVVMFKSNEPSNYAIQNIFTLS